MPSAELQRQTIRTRRAAILHRSITPLQFRVKAFVFEQRKCRMTVRKLFLTMNIISQDNTKKSEYGWALRSGALSSLLLVVIPNPEGIS